jgi:CheY-like chemotaxis protein
MPFAKARRILVVDDDLDTADTMAVLLRGMGHQVRFAIRGCEGLEMAREFRPEIIFLDLRLPDIDGCELAGRIRQVPGLESAILFAFTGYHEERMRAIAAGCDHFLVKPVDPALIDSLLAETSPAGGRRSAS